MVELERWGSQEESERESKNSTSTTRGDKLKKRLSLTPLTDGLFVLLFARFWLHSMRCALCFLAMHGDIGKASEKRSKMPENRRNRAQSRIFASLTILYSFPSAPLIGFDAPCSTVSSNCEAEARK